MKRPIVRFRLNFTQSRAADRRKGWEEMVAVGMDDLELARLNQANERIADDARWEGLRLIYGGRRRQAAVAAPLPERRGASSTR